MKYYFAAKRNSMCSAEVAGIKRPLHGASAPSSMTCTWLAFWRERENFYFYASVRRSTLVGQLPVLTQHVSDVLDKHRQENVSCMGWWSEPVRP